VPHPAQGRRATAASSRSRPRQRERATLFKPSAIPPRAATTVRRAIRAAAGELTSPSILQCAQTSLNLSWTQ
jgi:hypothetical protein